MVFPQIPFPLHWFYYTHPSSSPIIYEMLMFNLQTDNSTMHSFVRLKVLGTLYMLISVQICINHRVYICHLMLILLLLFLFWAICFDIPVIYDVCQLTTNLKISGSTRLSDVCWIHLLGVMYFGGKKWQFQYHTSII